MTVIFYFVIRACLTPWRVSFSTLVAFQHKRVSLLSSSLVQLVVIYVAPKVVLVAHIAGLSVLAEILASYIGDVAQI